MSYRIRPDATVRTNVRRLVRRELARALAALDEPGALGLQETVHDVRKRCKKVRGVLRLARPGLGAEYGRANAEVRDAARELSPLRDAHATLATLDELIASTHGERAAGGALTTSARPSSGARTRPSGPTPPARRPRRPRGSPGSETASGAGLRTTTSQSSCRACRATTAGAAGPTAPRSPIRAARPSTSGASAPSTAGTTPGSCSPSPRARSARSPRGSRISRTGSATSTTWPCCAG